MARGQVSSIHLAWCVSQPFPGFLDDPANTTIESSHGAAVRPRRMGGGGKEGEWGGADELICCVTKYQHGQSCSEEDQEQGAGLGGGGGGGGEHAILKGTSSMQGRRGIPKDMLGLQRSISFDIHRSLSPSLNRPISLSHGGLLAPGLYSCRPTCRPLISLSHNLSLSHQVCLPLTFAPSSLQ